jgi:hypothetical protein
VHRMDDRIDAKNQPVLPWERRASIGSVRVHANVAVPARDRWRLERLCCCSACLPVATGHRLDGLGGPCAVRAALL